LTTEEICEQLGISESNCWVMLHRARMSLRRSLEERWFLKEERRATGTGTPRQQSQSRIAAGVETLRRCVRRSGMANQDHGLHATQGQLQSEPV
jgi:hypothetical protein